MKKTLLLLVAVSLLLVVGCSDRTDDAEGGVILSITDFDGLPIRVSVNNQNLVQIGELTMENIAKDPNGVTSDLMNIELDSYEVTFTRADIGTRIPPAKVNGIFGVVPVNGENQIDNLDIMGLDQLGTPPLSDLLTQNGAIDSETGAQVIQLNVALRFFGRTLTGDRIVSNTARFNLEFVP